MENKASLILSVKRCPCAKDFVDISIMQQTDEYNLHSYTFHSVEVLGREIQIVLYNTVYPDLQIRIEDKTRTLLSLFFGNYSLSLFKKNNKFVNTVAQKLIDRLFTSTIPNTATIRMDLWLLGEGNKNRVCYRFPTIFFPIFDRVLNTILKANVSEIVPTLDVPPQGSNLFIYPNWKDTSNCKYSRLDSIYIK